MNPGMSETNFMACLTMQKLPLLCVALPGTAEDDVSCGARGKLPIVHHHAEVLPYLAELRMMSPVVLETNFLSCVTMQRYSLTWQS